MNHRSHQEGAQRSLLRPLQGKWPWPPPLRLVLAPVPAQETDLAAISLTSGSVWEGKALPRRDVVGCPHHRSQPPPWRGSPTSPCTSSPIDQASQRQVPQKIPIYFFLGWGALAPWGSPPGRDASIPQWGFQGMEGKRHPAAVE